MISEGSFVVLLLSGGERKLQRVRSGAAMRVGKHKPTCDPLLGAPFGANFVVETGGGEARLVRDQRTIEEIDASVTEVAASLGGASADATNAELNDEREATTAQSLSHAEIEALKAGGASGEALVHAIAAGSKTFASKTAFSQEKYLRKKARKHFQTVTALRPSPLVLCDHFMAKGPDKLMGLRRDSLSLLLTLSDPRPGARVLCLDGTSGLLPAALAAQLGGDGAVLAAHVRQPSLDGLQWLNLTPQCAATVGSASLQQLLTWAPSSSPSSLPSSSPPSSPAAAATAAAAVADPAAAAAEAAAGDGDGAGVASMATEASGWLASGGEGGAPATADGTEAVAEAGAVEGEGAEGAEGESGAAGGEEGGGGGGGPDRRARATKLQDSAALDAWCARAPRRWPAAACPLTRLAWRRLAPLFSSLVVATREAPAPVLPQLLSLLRPSSPFVVYSASMEPLAQCYHLCQAPPARPGRARARLDHPLTAPPPSRRRVAAPCASSSSRPSRARTRRSPPPRTPQGGVKSVPSASCQAASHLPAPRRAGGAEPDAPDHEHLPADGLRAGRHQGGSAGREVSGAGAGAAAGARRHATGRA